MKKKLDSLQALRAVACLVVFAHHSSIITGGTSTMCVFFMISGFTLVYSYNDRWGEERYGFIKSLKFAYKKIGKLYALYILCTLPILALDLLELSKAFSIDGVKLIAEKLVLTLLLIQSWIPNSDYALAFNGVSWYLSTALFLYMCFPFILRLVRKLRTAKAAAVAIIVLAAVQFALGFAAAPLESILVKYGLISPYGKFVYWFTYIFPPFRLFDFAIGCCVALIYEKVAPTVSPARCTALELVTVALFLSSSAINLFTNSFLTQDAFSYTQLFVPSALFAVFTFALGQGPIARLLTNRFTLFVSSISGDFFLVHQDIIRFATIFLSMLSIPYSTIKLIVPILCFAMTVLACFIWKKITGAAKKLAVNAR